MAKRPVAINPARCAKDFLALNPGLMGAHVPPVQTPAPAPKKKGKTRREMNQTEREALLVLQARFPKARIEYEGLTLRWPDGMRYTPDFVIRQTGIIPILIEIKGAYCWRQDLVKFRAARAYWDEDYNFEFWQKDENGAWQHLYALPQGEP